MPISRIKPQIDYSESLRRLMVAGLLMLAAFTVGIIGYRIIGHGDWDLMDCAYMTVITLTTVGFGEVIDLAGHPGARVFTMLLILFGMGTILFFVSTLTGFIVEGQFRDLLWRKKMMKELRNMNNHVIICGLGETGLHVAEEMIATGMPFVMVDMSEDRLIKANDYLEGEYPYIVGDASDDDILKEARIDSASGLIASCSEDKDNLFIIVSAKNLNTGIRVVTKAISVQSERKLRRAGADKVVTTNFIGGMRLASEMLRPTVTNFLDRMLHQQEKAIRLDEVDIEEGSPLLGQSLRDLDMRRNLNLTVLAVENKKERKYLFNPEAKLTLEVGMTLICMGEIEAVRKLREMSAG